MRWLVLLLLSLHLISPSRLVREGDLLFQQLRCGPLCEAIEDATDGYHHFRISHVGIVVDSAGSKYVLEAYGSVRLTPLDTFLMRSVDSHGRPKVIVARLKAKYHNYLPAALNYGLSLVGRPYDTVFSLDNEAYYCSELIYFMFSQSGANGLFHVYPMNFRSLYDGTMPRVWVDYFNKMGVDIPQGKLGCNPAQYSRSKSLKVLYILGKIDKNKFNVTKD